MPLVPFAALPEDARVWIFAASDALRGPEAERLLSLADEFLAQWKAHDEPLTCAREWRDERFLAIGVDQSTAGASGCSIDGLFRALQRLQGALGTALVGGGRVFYRDARGVVQCTDRAAFARLASTGAVSEQTTVFDTSIVRADQYRRGFEKRVTESWHGDLVRQTD